MNNFCREYDSDKMKLNGGRYFESIAHH